MKRFMARISGVASRVDHRDAIAITGLWLVAYGLWLVYVPAMYLGVGSVLLALWWTGRR